MLHALALSLVLADITAADVKFMNSLMPAIATCPKGGEANAAYTDDPAIPTATRAVKLLVRCGDRATGLTRARLYYMAADDLVNRVLSNHPDEDIARAGRAQAHSLIQKALHLAKSDSALVQRLNDFLDQLP